MANLKSVQATNAAHLPVPSADKQTDLIPIVGTYVTAAGLANGDIIEMCPLPAGYVPVDVILASEDLDSNGTPTVNLDVGVMSGTWGASGVRTCGAEFISASQVGRAGGVARMDQIAGPHLAPTTSDRSIGVKISAAIATLVVGAKIRLTVMARPQVEGV